MTEDVKLYIPVKYRTQKSKKKYSTMDKILVLKEFKRLGDYYERSVIEQIIDELEEDIENERNQMEQ